MKGRLNGDEIKAEVLKSWKKRDCILACIANEIPPHHDDIG